MADVRKLETSGGFHYLEFGNFQAWQREASAIAEARVEYVHNTWIERTAEKKIQDIATGLVAQAALAWVFDAAGLPYVSYDDSRIDAGRNDDPFDFVVLDPSVYDAADMTAWLQAEVYPHVNSQGRFSRAHLKELREGVAQRNGVIINLKSSVEKKRRTADQIVETHHHLAYAFDNNRAGYVDIPGREYLHDLGETLDEYVARKPAIKDFQFTVIFGEDGGRAYYVGFVSKELLLLDGLVGPLQGSYPWVAYHKLPVRSGYQPGEERQRLFPDTRP